MTNRMVLHGKDYPVNAEIQCGCHGIFHIGIILFTDGNAHTDKFVVGKVCQIFQSADSFLRRLRRLGKIIMKCRIRPP